MTDLLFVLEDMRNGQVAEDCGQKFNEVLKAVLDTGGKGEFTIKLFIRPSRMGMCGADGLLAVFEVEIEHECKLKKPEPAIGRSVFFVTKDGELTRDDPAQKEND
jgi:hypothetical protein